MKSLRKYPPFVIPQKAKKVRRTGKTNSLKRNIVRLLNMSGNSAFINNTVGIWDEGKQLYRRNRDRNAIGSGDVIACIKPTGHHAEIEVKTGNDVQSEDQKRYQSRLERAGGTYILVKDLDDFLIQAKNRKWL